MATFQARVLGTSIPYSDTWFTHVVASTPCYTYKFVLLSATEILPSTPSDGCPTVMIIPVSGTTERLQPTSFLVSEVHHLLWVACRSSRSLHVPCGSPSDFESASVYPNSASPSISTDMSDDLYRSSHFSPIFTFSDSA